MRGYDILIAGGGLAGLSLAILAAQSGRRVALIEKNEYPFHKLCGEYVSEESFDFLERLGVPLSQMQLPRIRRLEVSSPSGNVLSAKLAMGGFGISRSLLDATLAGIARQVGVHLMQNTEVTSMQYDEARSLAVVQTNSATLTAPVAVAAYGKKARPDIAGKRKFLKSEALWHRVGVKYHINHTVDEDLIALHNFKGGYCGISRIEEGKSCLCYLVDARVLQQAGSIANLEQNVMCNNPRLRHIFKQADFLFKKPVTVSNIYFGKKELYASGIFYAGDAGGVIDPLCGNGMSMALKSGLILHQITEDVLNQQLSISDAGSKYTNIWENEFAGRLLAGRLLRPVFGKKIASEAAIALLKQLPGITGRLVKLTHGKPF